MCIRTILIFTILIPIVELTRPTIKLTFTPDEKYKSQGQNIEIKCEILNANERTDSPQLWHIDLKTGKHTSISRLLFTSPSIDAPEVFKKETNKRYEYLGKNHIRIQNLQKEDSAKYECNCPDCERLLPSQNRNLYVMTLSTPKWIIEPGLPLHENTKSTIKCHADDFFPYVKHRILHNHQDITNNGSSSLISNNTYPQRFYWESTIKPTAEWHGTTLYCNIQQGNSEQQINQTLEVLFTPRFVKCDENQFIDTKKNQSTIKCSYSGNPQPTLIWLRTTDQKPITTDFGITIDTKNDTHGQYESVVTFNRSKLITIPLTTTTTVTTNNQNKSEANYYEQLLNNGFIVQLLVHGVEKDRRTINIIRDADEMRAILSDKSTTISLSSMLLSFLFILYIIQN